MNLGQRPLFTEAYESLGLLDVEGEATYLFGRSLEHRSDLPPEWVTRHQHLHFLEFRDQNDLDQIVSVGDALDKYILRVEDERCRLLDSAKGTLYFDITALNHATWAPLLKSAIERRADVRVVYQEPEDYKARSGTGDNKKFDLSEGRTLGPLPGFERYEPPVTSISGGTTIRDGWLVIALGFEGDRFGYLVSNQDFDQAKIVPVIGVPGFRIEFVAHALLGNQRPLVEYEAYPSLRNIAAHCPFSFAYLVEDLLSEDKAGTLTIAPIGTKPHAVGTVLAALAAPERVEIIYDHPIRKKDRSRGRGRTFVYSVSEFLRQWSLPTRTDIIRRPPSPRRWSA